MNRRIALAAALSVVLGTATWGVIIVGQSLAWQPDEPAPRTHVERLDLPPELTGTDAGLVTTPAPSADPDTLADLADLAAQAPTAPPATRSSAGAPAPVVAPAPVAAPVIDPEPQCSAGTEWQGEFGCVAVQLPEEANRGARCPDPSHVVVAVRADGSLVCGPADDTAEAQQ